MLLTGIIASDAKHIFLLINNPTISKSCITNEEYHFLDYSSDIQHALTFSSLARVSYLRVTKTCYLETIFYFGFQLTIASKVISLLHS